MEKVSSSYDVYIKSRDMKKARNANTASSFTRSLTRFVFTPDARQTCSVSGKPSVVKGQMPEVRTKLDQDGVQAIVGKYSTIL